ncbi:inactive rhomboid 1 isoform X1, partial [Brachionus plicatilis]
MNYEVKNNFWIGPSTIDLVHLGSKYAPCMRKDLEIYKRIEKDRLIEKETACCVRYDRGGCVQTFEKKCLNMSSRWDKWKNGSEISIKRNRTSGSVCGQDPDFCNDPGSKYWIDDITQWP